MTALLLLLLPCLPVQSCVASWYGPGFHGRLTASGETFDQNAMTCAHRALPLNSVIHVWTPGRKPVRVRVTDRGPFVAGRELDLSVAAFAAVADVDAGLVEVRYMLIAPVRETGHITDREVTT